MRRLLPLLLLAAACAAEPARPNAVLVVVDTLRADHTSAYGYERPTTPALEALAAEGVLYERAWAGSSWTLPSMNMLLTGELRAENAGRVQPRQAPLAEVLRARGYRTGAVVSNRLVNEGLDFHRGFDTYLLPPPARDGAPLKGWRAGELVDLGLEWLDGSAGEAERDGDTPFFLYLHFFDPHAPYWQDERPPHLAPAPSGTRREERLRALPEEQHRFLKPEANDRIERHVANYDSDVVEVDRALGRLMAALEERGLAESTVVAVTADHGEGLWQRPPPLAEDTEGGFFPLLYQGHGRQLHTEQVGVPLVLRGPGVPAGRRVAGDVSLLDVYPTLLGLLGVEVPPTVVPGGRPLPLEGEPPAREIAAFCSREASLTVDGRWRLVEPRPYRRERGVPTRLFDLERDPLELEPVDDPERVAAMRARLAEVEAESRVLHGEVPGMGAEQRALMQRLGYVDEGDEH